MQVKTIADMDEKWQVNLLSRHMYMSVKIGTSSFVCLLLVSFRNGHTLHVHPYCLIA